MKKRYFRLVKMVEYRQGQKEDLTMFFRSISCVAWSIVPSRILCVVSIVRFFSFESRNIVVGVPHNLPLRFRATSSVSFPLQRLHCVSETIRILEIFGYFPSFLRVCNWRRGQVYCKYGQIHTYNCIVSNTWYTGWRDTKPGQYD